MGDVPETCGPGTDRECCVNYCGVPSPYWDFILLPVTIDNLIEKFAFTRDIFQWLSTNLPEYALVESHGAELHIGRMAEFNRLFLEECPSSFAKSRQHFTASWSLITAWSTNCPTTHTTETALLACKQQPTPNTQHHHHQSPHTSNFIKNGIRLQLYSNNKLNNNYIKTHL